MGVLRSLVRSRSVWPRHVTRPRSNQRDLTEPTSPLPPSINTLSPHHGYVSMFHHSLDARRLAICTTQELSLQPAWTSPKVVRHSASSPPNAPKEQREAAYLAPPTVCDKKLLLDSSSYHSCDLERLSCKSDASSPTPCAQLYLLRSSSLLSTS